MPSLRASRCARGGARPTRSAGNASRSTYRLRFARPAQMRAGSPSDNSRPPGAHPTARISFDHAFGTTLVPRSLKDLANEFRTPLGA